MGRTTNSSFQLLLLCSLGAFLFGGAVSASAQTVPPPGAQAQAEEARICAEREAAERAAREAEPVEQIDAGEAPELGVFPQEEPCFAIRQIDVSGADHSRLRWVEGYLDQYRGRCAGPAGLDYIIRSLQGAFLDHGLITTRAGYPEQNLADGTLQVVVVPGMVSAVRVNGTDKSLVWDAASPVDAGDIIDLPSLEQGLEQMKRIPQREVNVDIEPGDAPGESVLVVTNTQDQFISGSVSANNYAGATVGRWQGSGQVAALGVLGLSEILSLSYNRRIDAPGVPADSQGTQASFSLPLGWWTFGVSGSANRYSSQVLGNVRDFETRGKLYTFGGFAERVIHRDKSSRTALRGSLTRRWARNYIDDIEIGIQRQDLSDLTASVIDRRFFGQVRLDSELSMRFGTGLFGAQEEADNRPEALPSARYRIAEVSFAAAVPLSVGALESYNFAFRGQLSGRNLYGSDAISVGGPFTVRGFDSDYANIGRSGWYLQQEWRGSISDTLKPFMLFDVGRTNTSSLIGGVGAGLRAKWKGFFLDGFVAAPIIGSLYDGSENAVKTGISVGWGF